MIAIGADHAGYELKEKIKGLLTSMGIEHEDFGTASTAPVDYPDFAHPVANAVESGSASMGILICGTGAGMEMTANRHRGIRASAVDTVELAQIVRRHNNANILALGARITPFDKAQEIIRAFLSTPFEGGRHQRRIDKIELANKQ